MDLSFWGQQASDSAPNRGLVSGHLELMPSASPLLRRQQMAAPALALSGPAEASTHGERRAEASAVEGSHGRLLKCGPAVVALSRSEGPRALTPGWWGPHS